MSFRLSEKARNYFRRIDEKSTSGKFDTMWDKYYLCLMAGFTEVELGDEISQEYEFIDRFIQDYYEQRLQIVAALVDAEIRRRGISLEDSEMILKIMNDLVEPSSPTCLSDEGHRLMNRYAEGGFNVISERIPQPYDFDMFLKQYYEKLIIS